MAKIKYSALVAGMRNKLNGSVASRNRYGDYFRNKTTPVNPQTTYQQNVRAQFGNLSAAWRGLTQAQRNTWLAAGENFHGYKDAFGDEMKLSGNALFISLNQNLLNTGNSQIDTAPFPVETQFLENFALSAAGAPGATVEMTWTNVISAGVTALVYAAANVPPGIKFVKNRLRLIATPVLTSTPHDITADLIARFGTLIANTRITVRVAMVDDTTGQVGVATEDSIIYPG